MSQFNICTLTDSYKFSHAKQYPQGTETVFSYFESRNGAKWSETVFFGLQYFLKEYLVGARISKKMIDQAEKLVGAHVGPGIFNRAGWEYILNTHGGRLPLRIKAVEEGTVVPVSNVLLTVENTDPNCAWLTNVFETLLSQLWHSCTVATQSREMKKIILKYLNETGDTALIDFKLHDFGYRGVSSVESAGTGGMAHLVNFKGTDTVRGLEFARDYYDAGICGFSIPASEHSTITSWGQEHEADAMANMLEQYPTGLVACVSDSYDIYNACEKIWGEKLKDKILAREGCLVIRPDSGNPLEILPKVFEILWAKFGGTINEKHYMVLNPKVRIIQGDGIDIESLELILECLKQNKISADNIAFGSGGGLLQKVNRDTQRFAFKCSAIKVNGEWRDVYKAPATDNTKNSKRGRLELHYDKSKNDYTTAPVTGVPDNYKPMLETVFEDGKIVKEIKFDKVRENARI